jgi:hypothetical protein
MNWQEVAGNWILVPPNPTAIVHFLGGAFVAAAPSVTYQWLLEKSGPPGLCGRSHPLHQYLRHTAIAQEVLVTFDQAMRYLDNACSTTTATCPSTAWGTVWAVKYTC